jgi:hypothetical protein
MKNESTLEDINLHETDHRGLPRLSTVREAITKQVNKQSVLLEQMQIHVIELQLILLVQLQISKH